VKEVHQKKDREKKDENQGTDSSNTVENEVRELGCALTSKRACQMDPKKSPKKSHREPKTGKRNLPDILGKTGGKTYKACRGKKGQSVWLLKRRLPEKFPGACKKKMSALVGGKAKGRLKKTVTRVFSRHH